MKSSHRLINRSCLGRTTAILGVAVAGLCNTAAFGASNREFVRNDSDPVKDPAFKWESSLNWTNDASNGPPPANDSTEFLYIASGFPGATIKFDGDTMKYYQNTSPADTAHHLAVGQGLSIGSIVISNGFSAPGTFLFGATMAGDAGTLNVNQFWVGGWGSNAGGVPAEGGGQGTLVMSAGQINIVGTASAPNNGTFELGYSNGNDNGSGPALGYGTMKMSGGTLNMGEGTMIVGFTRAYGTFSQSGGVVSVAADRPIVLGGSGTGNPVSGGIGYYQVTGGMVTAGSINFGRGLGSYFSSGTNTFTMQGGTVSVGSIGVAYTTSADHYTENFDLSGGTATINTYRMTMNQNGGTLSPGAGGVVNGGLQIGTMHLFDNYSGEGSNSHPTAGQGNYTQGVAGHLLLDIGTGNSDPTVSTNDRLQVEDNANGDHTTSATLNGEIDLRVNNTYSSPTIGDTFNIVTADAITDTSTLKVTHESPNYIFTKAAPVSGSVATGFAGSPTTSGQILQVAFAGHARPGDDTRDKTIDSSDFSMLAAHFGQSTTPTYTIGWGDGDFNGDGIVNALDFNALATNYGKGGTVEAPIGGAIADGETAASLGSVVPEPMSATILLGAMGISLLGRKRRSV